MSELGVTADRIWLRGALSALAVSDLIEAFGTQRVGQRIAAAEEGDDRLGAVTAAIAARFDGYFPVRLVAFQKSEEKSWLVPWHQDRVIAVQDQHAVDGFTNWSRKAGVWHCEPPRAVLDDMLFVRVFLDDCSPEAGAMTFARQSHELGKVSSEQAANCAADLEHETEDAKAGDIVVLPMLTLHKSDAGNTPSTRRVLRVDFARQALPRPLLWADAR